MVLQEFQEVQGEHVRVADIEGVLVAAVGVDDQRAVLADQHVAHAAGRTAAGFRAGADGGDGELVAAIDVAVVGQHVAAGVQHQAVAVVGDRDVEVVGGHRRIPGALDGDDELGDVFGAGGVAHAVAEGLQQGVAGLERLHRGQVVVHHIAVVAVGGHRQRAVGPGDRLAAADRGEGAAGSLAAGTDAVDGLAVAGIDVAVVAQQVAARVHPEGAVGGAAGLGGLGAVVDRQRVVVAPQDGDGEGRRAGGAGQVAGGVGEGLAEGVERGAQGLDPRVGVVDHVGVAAVGVQCEAAVGAGEGAADGADDAALAHPAGAEGLAVAVDVGVVE
ncbi:hypothetical protein D9M69_308930 [compost metagenome]